MSAITDYSTALTDLAFVCSSAECIIISINGGHSFRSKMYQIGIHEGIRVKVINNRGRGPLVIELKDTRLIIGRKMAEKIRVSGL